MPALSWSAGQDWVDGGVAAGKKASEDYTAKRYHQQGDEWQPDWVFAGAARDLEVLYTLATSWPTPCLAELEQGRVVPRRTTPAPTSANKGMRRGRRPAW